MTEVLGIDPGTHESAFIAWDGNKVHACDILLNDDFLDKARNAAWPHYYASPVAIEMIACYGMAVGKEVFETVRFIGRLQEAFEQRGRKVTLIYRQDVKLHHCKSARSKDGNVTQAIKDKYGGKGTKKAPGVFYNVKSHIWSALAVATYYLEAGLGKGDSEPNP